MPVKKFLSATVQEKIISARIRSIDRDCVLIDIENSWDSYVELPAEITLFQGLPKADKMELIIQKAVELGACAIVPVITKRTIVRWDEKKQDKKLARMAGDCRERCKAVRQRYYP